jgi:hypothetical protein
MNEPSPASPNGRHVNGRFAPGNQAAVGNPGNTRMKELRRALLECATEEKVKAVEESLHELAVGGDVAAAKVWLDHVVGKPLQAVEVSGPDGQGVGVEVLMTAVLAALAPYPEARLAVAARLKGVGRGHDAGPGDRAGDPA